MALGGSSRLLDRRSPVWNLSPGHLHQKSSREWEEWVGRPARLTGGLPLVAARVHPGARAPEAISLHYA